MVIIEPQKKPLQRVLTISISLSSMSDENIPNSETIISGMVFENEHERAFSSSIFQYNVCI